jgi:hypothetical protein
MSEGEYRQNQAVQRLFGPNARISGAVGTRKAPGHIEIKVDGKTVGSGKDFQAAMQAASRQLADHRC